MILFVQVGTNRRLTVLDPPCQRLRAEAGEHHGVHRTDTSTRQHGRYRQR